MIYKGFYISKIKDCEKNEGGYYCIVYDENGNYELDNFCIHKEDLEKYRDTRENSLFNNEDFIIENLMIAYIDNCFEDLIKLRKEVLK